MLDSFQGASGTLDTLHFIEERLGAGTWCWDLETDTMTWSRGFWALIGLDAMVFEPNGSNFRQALHPDDRRRLDELKQALSDMVPVEQELRIVDSTGRVHWSLHRAEALVVSSGRPRQAIGVCINATESHKTRHALKASSQRLEALVGMIDETVFLANRDGVTSRFWKKTHDESDERLESDDCWAAITCPEFRALTSERWKASSETGQPFNVEHQLPRPDGTSQWYSTQVAPIRNLSGDIQEWIGLSRRKAETDPSAGCGGEVSILTGVQIRAGRAIARLSVHDLSELARVSPSVIRRLEESNGSAPLMEEAHFAIRAVLEKNGVEFVFSPNKKPGVRAS
jgi:PAS domain S-box-containing protein